MVSSNLGMMSMGMSGACFDRVLFNSFSRFLRERENMLLFPALRGNTYSQYSICVPAKTVETRRREEHGLLG